MASLDSLPADQKAVLSLVIQRGRSFDQIAALLSIDRAAVRQRALAGFDALGPESSLDPLKRGLITDYLLGQLPPAVAETVRSSLATHPAERAWARVIAAEIAPLAINGLPEIPAAAAARPAASRRASEPESTVEPGSAATAAAGAVGAGAAGGAAAAGATASGIGSGDAGSAFAAESAARTPRASEPRSSRRGGAILLGLIAAAIIVVVVVLLVTGGSSTKKAANVAKGSTTALGSSGTATTASGTGTTTATPLHQINMTSPTSIKGREGAADVVRAAGKLGLVLVAEGLEPNTRNAYGVWLYNSSTQTSDFLGFYGQKVASTGSTKGELEAEVALPTNATSYNELLLTLETAEKPTKPGPIVLEGTFAE